MNPSDRISIHLTKIQDVWNAAEAGLKEQLCRKQYYELAMNTPYPNLKPPAAPEGMKWEYIEAGQFVGGIGEYCFLNSAKTEWIRAVNCGGFFSPVLKAVPILEDSEFEEAAPMVRGGIDHFLNSLKPGVFPHNMGGTENPLDPKAAEGAKKTQLHLLPPIALAEAAKAHQQGSEKYGPYNWRGTKVCASTYISAMMRHLDLWRDGEDLAPDSGVSHLGHIIASANILLDAAHCGTLVDDRAKVTSPASSTPEHRVAE